MSLAMPSIIADNHPVLLDEPVDNVNVDVVELVDVKLVVVSGPIC